MQQSPTSRLKGPQIAFYGLRRHIVLYYIYRQTRSGSSVIKSKNLTEKES